MPVSTLIPAAHPPFAAYPRRPLAVLITMVLALGTVALGAGAASAAEPGGPAFGPATTASMYVGEAASITEFVPTGGTNTVVQVTSGMWMSFLNIDPDGRLWTDDATGAGTLDISLLATDDQGRTDTTTFTLTIYQRPMFYSADTAEFQEDVDGEFHIATGAYPTAILDVTGLPSDYTFTDEGSGFGVITGRPAIGSSGTYPVVITSQAGVDGPTTTQNLTLNVTRRSFTPGPYAELSGALQVGAPITANYGGNSPAETSATYEWYRNGELISEATGASYTPAANDLDQDIHAVVTVHRTSFNDASDASDTHTITEGTMSWEQYPHVVGDPEGDDRVGDTVTVEHGTLEPAADSYTYQWFRNFDQPIADATTAEYTLTPADADAGFLTVIVTAHKAGYTSTSMNAMMSVRDADFTTQPTLTIDGNSSVGSTVTAETTEASPSPDSTELHWFRDGVEFANAGSTYTFVPSDVDSVIRVEYTNLKDGYMPGYAAQDLYADLGRFSSDPVATVTGDPVVGSELTVSVDPLTPAADALTYEWLRDGDPIDGVTGTTYTLTQADAGKYVAVIVTASTEGYYDASSWTDASDDVIGGGTFTVAPVVHIVGDPVVGNELHALVEGTTPEAEHVTYVWLRDGVAIPGADDESYVVTAEDIGSTISLRATTSASGFSDAVGTSDATVTVPTPTTPVTPPTASKLTMSLNVHSSIRRVFATVRAKGLAPREKYQMTLGRLVVRGQASATGTVVRKVYLPRWLARGHRVVTMTGLTSRRVARTGLRVIIGRNFRVRPAATAVQACQRTSVRILDLSPHERVVARYDGVRFTGRRARANRNGVYTARFNVRCSIGNHTLVVRGAYPRRMGSVTLAVRR